MINEAAPPHTAVAAPDRTYRPELQGLRALAVGLVVVYHVWFGRVSGGVDVFFVISGFLLTGQLLRAGERGPIGLRRRWSRMVLRLLPAAFTVLLGTVAAGAVLLPEGRWPQTVREVVASALFLENWQLAADSVDYAARSNAVSVVQHFWSLSIQGQFFLVWPLLVALLARRAAAGLHASLTVTLLAAFAASLAYSVGLTVANQPLAYFHSLTRVWEFALGGLLVLWIDRVTLSRTLRVLLGWAGVLGLLVCGMVLQVSTVFPGWAALWPTLSAVLVLVAGATGSRHGADRFLAARPARYLGDLSFALYLWHWPVLVLYAVAREHDGLGPGGGLAVIGLSLVLAALTHHLIERPVLNRSISVRGAYRLGAAGLVAVLLAAGIWQLAAVARAAPGGVVGDSDHPGARALFSGSVEPAALLPPPVSVYEDWLRSDLWDCAPLSRFPSDACTRRTPSPPARHVVVVGDSHIQQLASGLVPLAERFNWELTAILRGACPFSTASEVVPDEPGCLEWNAAAAAEIADIAPDAVVTLASRDVRVGLTEQTPPGFVEQWARLEADGIPVLALRDNPRFGHSVPDCVEQLGRGSGACGVAREEVYTPVPPWALLPDLPGNVTFLDTADLLCDAERCPSEIGNVLVYLDDNHVSASYATSLADFLDEPLAGAFLR